MEENLRERHLYAVGVVEAEGVAVHVGASRRIVLPQQRAAETAGSIGMAADHPVALIQVVYRHLDNDVARALGVEEPVLRRTIVREIVSRMALRLHHDDLA